MNASNKIKFEDIHLAKVGFKFFIFNIRMNNKVIKLQIWDTCDQVIKFFKDKYLQKQFSNNNSIRY